MRARVTTVRNPAPSMMMTLVFSAVACDDGGPDRINTLVQTRNPLPDVVADGTGVVDTALTDSGGLDLPDLAVPDSTPPRDSEPPRDTAPLDTTATDTTVDSADTRPSDTGDATDTGPVAPVDINTDWIGGACAGLADCPYDGAMCLTAADGLPGGLCSETCTKFCPDQAGAVTTFCVEGEDVGETGGMCVTKCDFGESPTGCREGYACVARTRYNDPTTMAYVCLPGTGELDVSSCIQELIAKGVGFELASNPMDVPADQADPSDICDVHDPIYLDPVIDGVTFRPSDFGNAPKRMFVQCPVALAIYDTVQLAKSRGVTDIIHYGTYNCRYIAGTTSLSEHAFANAIDLAGFQLQDGGQYTVLADWDSCDPTPEAIGGELLYWLAHAMHDEGVWNIILTPEYNAAHDDHLHVDLTEGADFLADCP